MSKAKFDWIKFHKLLHNGKGVDPQFAEIFPEKRDAVYSFRVKAIDPKTNFLLHPCGPNGDIAAYNATVGFVTSLKIFYPCLEIIVGKDKNVTYLDNNEIMTVYRARTNKEINEILAYLRTVPIDLPPYVPNKTDTRFCYD